jgi:hypothetical protein
MQLAKAVAVEQIERDIGSNSSKAVAVSKLLNV